MKKHNYSTMHVDGFDRRYVIHLPEGHDPQSPMPLVIMLHGAGATAYVAIEQTGWTEKADREGFIAVFPETVASDESKRSILSNPALWNDGSGRGFSAENDIDDSKFIRELIQTIQSNYVIDKNRIFITGFSNGAAMTFRAGAELSDIVAAVAPVAGQFNAPNPKLTYPVSLIYFVGDEDTFIPVNGGTVKLLWGGTEERPPVSASLLKWGKLLGCPEEPQVFSLDGGITVSDYSPCMNDSEVICYVIEGLGHNWPGGVCVMNEKIAGKSSDKLCATDVIWEFFKKHPRK